MYRLYLGLLIYSTNHGLIAISPYKIPANVGADGNRPAVKLNISTAPKSIRQPRLPKQRKVIA